MRFVPLRIKHAAGKGLRKHSYPYHHVQDGSVIVLIGAPQDTLHSGRSRGMYFSLFAGKRGKVLIIEPDHNSLNEYRSAASALKSNNLSLCSKAVWSEKKNLRVYINDAHPASSFTEGKKAYQAEVMREYRVVELEADTLDHILAEYGLEKIDLVSITTNGAESEIFRGMQATISNGLPYICLAKTGTDYQEMMEKIGYKLYSYDDRGFTFVNKNLNDSHFGSNHV
jgi:FkbM family methyltransferase